MNLPPLPSLHICLLYYCSEVRIACVTIWTSEFVLILACSSISEVCNTLFCTKPFLEGVFVIDFLSSIIIIIKDSMPKQ